MNKEENLDLALKEDKLTHPSPVTKFFNQTYNDLKDPEKRKGLLKNLWFFEPVRDLI